MGGTDQPTAPQRMAPGQHAEVVETFELRMPDMTAVLQSKSCKAWPVSPTSLSREEGRLRSPWLRQRHVRACWVADGMEGTGWHCMSTRDQSVQRP